MSFNGAYLIGSQTLRLCNLETSKISCQWHETAFNPQSWTSKTLEERMNKVFEKITRRVNCLVLINSMQLPADLLQTAYNVAIKNAVEVYLISGIVARLQWAVKESMLDYLKNGDKALVAYISKEICEFDEIEVKNSKFILNSVQKCQKFRVQETLRNRENLNEMKSIVLIFTKKEKNENDELKEKIMRQYPALRYHCLKENPEFMMLDGGLAKASIIFPGNNSVQMCIQDFSSGFQVEYVNEKGKNYEPLIPFNTNLPAVDTVTLSNVKSFCIKYNVEMIVIPSIKPLIARAYLKSSTIQENKEDGSVKITARIDKYGVPYIDIQKIPDPTVARETGQMKFIIKLKANWGSIWVKSDTEEYALPNVSKNEWTPFYVSFLKPQIRIGERAQSHWEKSPKHVMIDVHKIIGIPMKKIVHDKTWHFKVVVDGDDTNYGKYKIETPEGPQTFSAETIMSMFLRALKRLALDHLKMNIDHFSIHVSSDDYKPEQIPFIEKAATDAGIILESIKLMKL